MLGSEELLRNLLKPLTREKTTLWNTWPKNGTVRKQLDAAGNSFMKLYHFLLSQEQLLHQPTRAGTSNLSLALLISLSPSTEFRPGQWKDQRIPFCCETTLWPAKTSDLVFHCWSYWEEICMSKPPSFYIWLSHHLSSSYKEREKTAHSICAGDPRKKQPLSTTDTQVTSGI